MIKGSFEFASFDETKDLIAEFKYDDEWFLQDARTLDPNLRMISLVMAMSGFPSVVGGEHNQYKNAKAFMEKVGFTDFEVNEDYKKKPSKHTLGIFAARKEANVNGEDITIVALGFRGAAYGLEWYENTILGKEGPARGFMGATDRTYKFLTDYLVAHVMKEGMDLLSADVSRTGKKIKLWIAGYSRSAAVANLLGKVVVDRLGDEKNTFVYTFECPKAATFDDNREYKNIHNCINPVDFVPLIIPNVWGFARCGVDDTILPAPEDELWSENIKEVERRMSRFVDDIGFDEKKLAARCVFRGKLAMIDQNKSALIKNGKLESWWFDIKRVDYIRNFIEFMGLQMAPSLGIRSTDTRSQRDAYVDFYQESFAYVSQSYLGAQKEKRLAIRTTLNNYSKELMLDTKAQNVFYLKLLFGTRASIKKLAHQFVEDLIGRLEILPEFENDTKELRTVASRIEPLAYYFLFASSRDTKTHGLAYGLTFGDFISTALKAHMPEYTFTWLEVLGEK